MRGGAVGAAERGARALFAGAAAPKSRGEHPFGVPLVPAGQRPGRARGGRGGGAALQIELRDLAGARGAVRRAE